jgi:hypothetical protein
MLTSQPTGWDQDPSALDKLSPEEVSFERCFYIYGGPEYLEVRTAHYHFESYLRLPASGWQNSETNA